MYNRQISLRSLKNKNFGYDTEGISFYISETVNELCYLQFIRAAGLIVVQWSKRFSDCCLFI